MVINYEELIDDAIEFNKKYTILTGVIDVVNKYDKLSSKLHPAVEFVIHEINDNSFWVVSGYPDIEMIKDAFIDLDVNVDRDGEYDFKALLLYESGDCDEFGRIIGRAYLYVEYINLTFIQSFESRERESKINSILSDNLFDI